MASGVGYERVPVGTAVVYPLGSVASPSILFGEENAQGGLNDGIYGTSGPGVGISINGVAVAVVTAATLAVTGAITATTSIKSSGATQGIGYATGAGGAVTQDTNRTTGVTLNTITGTITTSSASLAAEASADFVVTNSAVAIGDVVVLSMQSGSNGGGTLLEVVTVAAGSFTIRVHNGNVAAGTAETGAILINFAVIKAVSA